MLKLSRHSLCLSVAAGALLALTACRKDADGRDSDTSITAGCESEVVTATAPEELTVSDAPSGDISCLDAWLPACPISTAETATDIKFRDFRTGEPVGASATLNGADLSLSNGTGSATLPTCSPVELSVSDEAGFVNRYPDAVPALGEVQVDVVASSTHSNNYGQVGQAIKSGSATIYGKIVDCAGNGISGVQVYMVEGGSSFYDREAFPSPSAESTDRSGRFYIMNARAGSSTVQAWVSDSAGGYTLLGRTRFQGGGDEVVHVNIQSGGVDDYALPETCLE
ncbi:MAG: hypothetical protein ACI9VR_001422 [Cognaticolwellia sp.]